MNWQKITEMPCVINVLRRAEQQITEMTGKDVVLMVSEVNLTHEVAKAILQDAVCNHFDVSWKDIYGKSRKQRFAEPRHVYMYLASKLTGSTFKEIGTDCGGRDHTTVTNAVKKINGYYQVEDGFIIQVEAIKNKIPKDLLK